MNQTPFLIGRPQGPGSPLGAPAASLLPSGCQITASPMLFAAMGKIFNHHNV
jgi:hypothetical protein